MVTAGNFFFKYRNILFIFLYLAIFIPSPRIFGPELFGERYFLWPIVSGLIITLTGQIIRGLTIGLAYIVRGGSNKKVYADKLVTEGIFNHGRNPLYVGNVLMLAGVGILSNSLVYILVFVPLFIFIYQAIILAEEHFLSNKFGADFEAYCQQVNRWWINPSGIVKTIRSMKFNYRRWIIKEYNTQFVWLTGITLILLTTYSNELTNSDTTLRNLLGTGVFITLAMLYLLVRYLKKSGKLVE